MPTHSSELPQKEEKLDRGREEVPIRRLKSLPGPSLCCEQNRKGREEIRLPKRRHFLQPRQNRSIHLSRAAVSAATAPSGFGSALTNTGNEWIPGRTPLLPAQLSPGSASGASPPSTQGLSDWCRGGGASAAAPHK